MAITSPLQALCLFFVYSFLGWSVEVAFHAVSLGKLVNRKASDRYGLTVWLCHKCHNEPPHGVHHNATNPKKLQRRVQSIAMRHYKWSVEEFRLIFGKNYL